MKYNAYYCCLCYILEMNRFDVFIADEQNRYFFRFLSWTMLIVCMLGWVQTVFTSRFVDEILSEKCVGVMYAGK